MSQGSQARNGFAFTPSGNRSTAARQRLAAAVLRIEALEPRRFLTAEMAKPAENFVDSIGVNAHFTFPGTTNPYTKQLSIDLVKSLGVRHIRSGDYTSTAKSKLAGLYDSAGVQTLLVPPANAGDATPASLGASMSSTYAEAIEGLNEPANWLHTYNGYTDVWTDANGKTVGDFTATRQFNNELYAAAKQHDATKPVLSSAMGNPQMNPYLAGTNFDIQAMHPYPGTGAMADFYKYDNFDQPSAALTAPGKDIWNTESGYYTAGNVSGSVTEAAEGKFVPRMLTEFFDRGVKRTYLYELVDEGAITGGVYAGSTTNDQKENSYGLARNDGTPKPAFTAVKNLISLTNQYPTWNATTHSFGIQPTTTTTLDYTLAHDPSDTSGNADVSDVHHLLLEKSTGEFDLLLWRESSKNDTTGSRKINITVNSPVTSATLYSDLTQASMPTTTWSNHSSFSFDVSDSVVMLKLTPGTSTAPQSLGVSDSFEGQTTGQSPSGWTSAGGDTTWAINNVKGNGFAQNNAASGDHYLSKTIAANDTSFTTDFDYTWHGGGTTSYGDYAQTVGADFMDVSGNGYRVVLHQGNSGNAANSASTVEIYQLDAGVQGARLGAGTGFNQAGWGTLGYASPNFHHIRVAYDSGVFTVYGDTNFNGTPDILATANATAYTSFTRLKLRSLGSTGSSGPAFDNVQTDVPTVSIAAIDASAAESPVDTGKFRITRSGGDVSQALTVNYLVYGSAASGSDYTAIPASVTIQPGATSADITVTPTADNGVEGDENVVLRLSEWSTYHVSDVARTADVLIKDAAADLVVTGVVMSNTRPVAGDTITYQVKVKNIGNATSAAGWKVGILFDTQGASSFITSAQPALTAGSEVQLSVTGSYTYTASAGNHQLTAWVDPPADWASATGVVPESNDRNNAFVSSFRVASTRTPASTSSLTDWSTVDAGWVVKTTGTQTYLENTANTSSTRSLKKSLTTPADHSWSLDFAHNWQYGGSGGYGAHSLSMSADVLDDNGNGFRVRFYQGSGGNTAAYGNQLVQIFRVTGNTTETLLGSGQGFDAQGWKALNPNGVPTWRSSRLTYDVGTRTLGVWIDKLGNGAYSLVASGADLSAPHTFTKLGFNAENLINAVAPELDDISFDTLY